MHHPWLLVLASPLWWGAGWLAWRHAADGGAHPPRARLIVVAGSVLALFALMAWVPWTNPIEIWWSASSAAHHRMLPLIWALTGLPLWAGSLVLFPQSATGLLHTVWPNAGPFSTDGIRIAGWTLLSVPWLLFGLLAWVGR